MNLWARRAGTLVIAAAMTLSALWSQEASSLTDHEKEEFLLQAEVVRSREISTGINNTRRLTLSDGRITHDAHFSRVDIRKNFFDTPQGREFNFRDCYKFNNAGYKLDRLLGLQMVPVSVERRVGGNRGSVTWWVDDVLMMDKERYRRKIEPPDAEAWNDQMYQVRVLNELIYNTDPNLGNLLITKDWKIRLIDFTRAFRQHKTLREPKNLVRIDRRIYEGLRKLDEATLMRELEPFLTNNEIKAILARRDKIVAFFDERITKEGEVVVICDLPGH